MLDNKKKTSKKWGIKIKRIRGDNEKTEKEKRIDENISTWIWEVLSATTGKSKMKIIFSGEQNLSNRTNDK